MKGRRLLDAMTYIDDALIEEAAPSFGSAAKAPKRKRIIFAFAAAAFAAAVSLWIWKDNMVVVQQTEENAVQDYDMAKALMTADSSAVGENDFEADAVTTETIETDAENAKMAADMGADIQMTDKLSETEYSSLKDREAVNIIEAFPQLDDTQEQAVSGQSAVCYKAPEKGEYFLYSALAAAIDYYDNNVNTMDLAIYKDCVYHVTIDVFGERTEEGGTVYEELRLSEEGKKTLCDEYNRMLSIGLTVSLSEDYELTGLLSSEEIKGFEPCEDYGYAFRLINE